IGRFGGALGGADDGFQLALGGRRKLSTDDWRAVDRFHATALSRLTDRLDQGAQAEAARLGRRTARAADQSARLLDELAQIIVPREAAPAAADVIDDPLFSACRTVAETLGVEVRRPAARASDREDFRAIGEIARTSRLRVRRTLLRAGWWRRDAGPLVAWIGEARQPLAILPAARGGYVVVDPRSGARRRVDETLAQSISLEAATFYRPLPDGDLPAGRLLRWMAHHSRADIARILLAATALAIIGLTAPVVTALLVDGAIPRSDLGQLAFCAAALLMAAVGAAGLQAVQGVATLRLSGVADWTLQAAVMDRLLRLPATFFKAYTAGDLADRVLGVAEIRQVLTGRAIGGVLAGVFCLFGVALMFAFEARLALAASILIVIQGGVIVTVSAARLQHERRYFDLHGKTHGLVLQLLTGIGKLRVAAATTRALAQWVRRFSQQKGHFVASQRIGNRLTAFQAGFPTLASLIVFALAVREPSGIDAGRFLAFFAAFGQSLAAVASLGAAVGEILIAAPFFARLRPVLSSPVETPGLGGSTGEISGAVELSQVMFRYAGNGAMVLEGLSFAVEPGEFVALVGPSGGGKSTIFRLMLGFERALSGAILFDGCTIDMLDIAAVRRQIGVVLQNGKLTSGSIFENICGAVQVPIEQAWEAARHAGLDADIEAMPMGMHTVVNEGVSTLSGGQRQRLMIARALVHRPRLLLFDEATSALDNRTQSIVSSALAKLGVTRIVIAHRLSTVRDADRIFVIAGGAVAQVGTFDVLDKQPGPFADLARRQLV
ncbi:MAG TPA: NHLP bacteriocin export ABC transporter permease/ATPase subunit, partial [Phenylobacterium sp.]|nr:NHLP bacteriocin export ABC transporter permease/ATPase subunit [Phenylobacterium sp.]